MGVFFSYIDFLRETQDMSEPVEPGITLNYADETMEGLRRRLLDDYMPTAKNEEVEKTINSCISTYVYSLDKKLKIDEDIIKKLGEAVGKSHEDMSKELADKTREYYDGSKNVIG
jgi:hypothetical protein